MPMQPETSISDGFNFLKNQLSSPQPKSQHIVVDIDIASVEQTVLVETEAQLEQLRQ